MLTSSNNKQRVFLTSSTKIDNTDSKFEIILSPEFYWVRRFEIPVKNEKQALKVLPSLFEDIVHNDMKNLTYQVKKIDENTFLSFAFNSETIQNALKTANIPLSNVATLYFAQNECEQFQSFECDNQKYTYTNEKILVKIPNNLLGDTVELDSKIDDLPLSSFKVDMRFYSSFLSSKVYYMTLAVLGVFICINLIKYSSYNSEITSLEKNIQIEKETNSLPPSILQIDSIFKKYETTILKEKQKREAIAYLVSNKRFDLKSLTLKNNVIELEYLSANKLNVEKFLSKKFKIISSNQGGFFLKVRIKI